MKGIVFSDSEDALAQTLTFFRDRMELDAAIYSKDFEKAAGYGAKKLYNLTGEGFSDNIALALEELSRNGGYDYTIICSTAMGREVAGILSEKLGKETMTEIFDFELNDGRIRTKRFSYGGKTVLEEESDCRILTVMPGIADAQEASEKSEITEHPISSSSVSLVETIPKELNVVDLEKANVIVTIGRGLGKKEGIEQVMPLVEAVRGELAGSRPVCLDYQWLTEDRQVGLSGRKVKPKVYIALGVSGQIQHIAGMRGSKTVIAVNKDKSAPIFEEADYGIVGDLYQVVPKLVQALKS